MLKMNHYSLKILLFLYFLLYFDISDSLLAQNQTINSGSYIVNMGSFLPTVNNSLKPYGLIYDLLNKKQIPVLWSINPTKLRDSIDFRYNGVDYKGGPFIIEAQYRTPSVDSLVTAWQARGVIVTTTTSSFVAPIYREISYVPNWTLDSQNGKIAEDFLIAAGFPTSAYNWIAPAALGCCNDVFVMPHADPTWATHGRLLDWNNAITAGGCLGAIWQGCHAVSVAENLFDAANTARRLNLLMANPVAPSIQSAIPFGSHANGSPPYNYFYPTHPVMQFIGQLDNATTNGSEQIYIPSVGGWLPTTQLGVVDLTQANVPSLSPGPATVLAFGQGKGDANRGKVMYTGGHNIGKAIPGDYVNAQRTFFNFSFWAAGDKAITVVTVVPSVLKVDSSYSFTATPTGGTPPYNYTWLSSCGGVFTSTTNATTLFRPTSVSDSCLISCRVTDACGTRIGFKTTRVQTICVPPVDSLVVCQSLTCSTNNFYNLNNLKPVGNYPYEWHIVSSNPSPATRVSNPANVTFGDYYLYRVGGSCYSLGKKVSIIPKP